MIKTLTVPVVFFLGLLTASHTWHLVSPPVFRDPSLLLLGGLSAIVAGVWLGRRQRR